MKKYNLKYLVVFIGIIICILGNISLFSAGDTLLSVEGKCIDALEKYTFGAGKGECFVHSRNNENKIMYVKDVNEIKTSAGRISCQININSNKESIFGCATAKSKDGNVKVCEQDSSCSSKSCANYMCRNTLTRDCTIPGSRRCSECNVCQKCLSNQKWSGLLK